MKTLKIFIGYDPKEAVAFHVLCHSLLERSSKPISITPINLKNLKGLYSRQFRCDGCAPFLQQAEFPRETDQAEPVRSSAIDQYLQAVKG